MSHFNFYQAIFNFRWLIVASAVLFQACSTIPTEGSAKQYTSQHQRATHTVDGFNVRSVTQAPEQIVLMFRVDIEPAHAFELVSDIEQLSTWFTDIQNPAMDNTHSSRGPNAMGVNSIRSCSLDGEYLYEDIVHYDEKNLSYAYSINFDKSTVNFPISNQVSLFTVESDEHGGSLVTWRHYYDKNFHITAPVLNFAMKKMILEPAVDNLISQYGGEKVKPTQI